MKQSLNHSSLLNIKVSYKFSVVSNPDFFFFSVGFGQLWLSLEN